MQTIAKSSDDFHGIIIPKHILLSDTTGTEMLVLSMIDGFTRSESGMYWGTRKFIASSLGISEKSTVRAIKTLVEKGYLLEVNKNGIHGYASADPSKFAERRPCEY